MISRTQHAPGRGGAFLSLFAALALSLLARAEEPAREILLRSLEPRVTTYAGDQESVVTGGAHPDRGPQRPPRAVRAGRQRVYRCGKVLRIEYRNGQVLYDDGTRSLLYLPRQKLVERGPSRLDGERVKRQRRALSGRRLTVEQLPDGEAAGRPTYVILVRTPRGMTRKVWIDRQTYVQLRLDESWPEGRSVSTYFTRIDYQADLSPEKLAFTPPPDVQYVERGEGRPIPEARAAVLARAWGGLMKPRVLPAGYVFQGFYRCAFQGRPALVAIYAGPGPNETLSIFQGPAMGMGGMAGPADRQSRNLHVLSTRKGAADVTLVAPLSEEDLQKVMDSIN